jgi:hypothetical protein
MEGQLETSPDETRALGPSLRLVLRQRQRYQLEASCRVNFGAKKLTDNTSKGAATMEDHDTRRKIIRQWMALPKDKRQTEEQVAAFAKNATQQNEFHRSRRDPDQRFRRDPYQKVMGWLLPRAGKS